MADLLTVLNESIKAALANYEKEAVQIAEDPAVPTNKTSDDVREPENDEADTNATPEETAEVQATEEAIADVAVPTINKELVLATADQMAEQTTEMRLSEFKHRLDEMDKIISALGTRVSELDGSFRALDSSIEQTRILSPSVKTPRDYSDILTVF